ncbi:ABC transporter ATP-binding protein [Jiangella gansuensis]|uniref:ABC transporter ATP-binding protein n=1 Tax=Jiangella gansuensis TaxID=281473 RepID=UPI0004BC7E6B|nr:ABC transporter ATP-binding protein [Jiangella gansuensis]
MGDVVEVTDLRRSYSGGFEAVRGVTFTVARGELFALLGTNGAGKTSTLELVEGLARPSAGQVRVLGGDPYADRATVRPRIGVMLQQGGFPPDLTVRETARMWAGTLSTPRPIEEALELVRMIDRADVGIKQLSGGERRRLDLALAVMGRPEVLFLDEPTTGLDPESRRDTWALVRSMLDDGVTVLLTTHYLDEAEELADRLAIMHKGRVVRTGTVAEVVATQPATVSFELESRGDRPQLPDLSGALVVDNGVKVEVRTDRLQSTLTTLLLWAAERGLELDQLSARPASLEQAFLAVADEADVPTNEEVFA